MGYIVGEGLVPHQHAEAETELAGAVAGFVVGVSVAELRLLVHPLLPAASADSVLTFPGVSPVVVLSSAALLSGQICPVRTVKYNVRTYTAQVVSLSM